MHVHLGGHLAWYQAERRSRVEIECRQDTPLLTVIEQLGIPPAEIAIALLNGKLVPLDNTLTNDHDHLELYPPFGGGK